MVKFSVGGEDDVEGPSSPRPKKRRTNSAPIRSQQQDQDEQNHEFAGTRVCRLHDEDNHDDEPEETEESEQETQDGEPLNYGEEQVEENEDSTSSISVTLTDPEVLDCPICLEPFTIPVYQCENGHAACSCCCRKLANKCPSCSWPIGYNRCRALEKVLESLKMSCPNKIYGCPEMPTYNKTLEHEKVCIHGPCCCPVPSCKFVGSSNSLVSHFRRKHSSSAKYFSFDSMFKITVELREEYLILQEKSEGAIFVLYNVLENSGNTISVGCIGPKQLKKGFTYDLIARSEGNTVRLQAFADIASSRNEHSRKIFLVVPDGFTNLWHLQLELCIRKV
ncbi:E3 ubiquitin-protein ligase SINA-like 10 [Impatiens glandulifera]|uniref:E3 ubiquitin-protein ligase SINA-like 10 n=1 Tax=Impatiens glandulifera TaxID=253017 RepID=UPI001FB127AF|nr:E3 ubiquitin-protein ligase SINA-like 10 [Impatiens glandulifera]